MFGQGAFQQPMQQPMQQQTYQQTMQNNMRQASFQQLTEYMNTAHQIPSRGELQSLMLLLKTLQENSIKTIKTCS